MVKPPKDIAASVRARLLNLSREQEQDFQRVLVSYGLERLLYRLSVSKHRERYILKGGMLVTLWTIDPGRFTQDIDFLAFGHDDEERLQADFTEILGQEVDDGLLFDLDALTAAPIRDDQVSATVRAYSPETVISEKFQAVIALGIVNSRMKDFYDLYASDRRAFQTRFYKTPFVKHNGRPIQQKRMLLA